MKKDEAYPFLIDEIKKNPASDTQNILRISPLLSIDLCNSSRDMIGNKMLEKIHEIGPKAWDGIIIREYKIEIDHELNGYNIKFGES